jgi:quinol monooxygenase YgiN
LTIKVIMERNARPGMEAQLVQLLHELRINAIRQQGFISGETLFSVNQPGLHMVIGTWRSLQDWKKWEKDPQRTALLKKIDPLLTGPAKTSEWAVSPPALEQGA